MASESSFFLTKIECPICGTYNEFENIKMGSYSEQDHDTDFCPTGREWRNSKYEIYNPLLFFMVTCDSCFYTREFNRSFREWKNDTSFKTYRLKNIKERHLLELNDQDSVLHQLGSSQDMQHNPFGTAVVKLLLGIYDEMLLDHPRKLDLGRFFLRIGWLYREHYGNPLPSNFDTAHFAKDIKKAYAKLRLAGSSFSDNLHTVSSLLDQQLSHRDTSMEDNSEFLNIYDNLKNNVQQLTNYQNELTAMMKAMNDDVDENCKFSASKNIPSSGVMAPFAGFQTFEDFINDLKNKWEYVPVNEIEALAFAVEFYRASLENGNEIQQGNQQIQATYLIAELTRRIGSNHDAKQYFNNTIKVGQQYIFDNRNDKTRTALAKKIVELAVQQGKLNLKEIRE